MRPPLNQLPAARRAWIVALLVLATTTGVILGNDYGAGADEALDATTGERALTAYTGPEGYRDYLSTGPMVAHFGPPYFILFTQASRAFASMWPDWPPSDGRHLMNYLTLLAGLICFYGLCRRLLPDRIAFMTTMVFATQPVLFGLGFIDHKDTPFMALFVASLLAAVWTAETAVGAGGGGTASGALPEAQPAHTGLRQALRQDWRSARPVARWVLAAAVGALALAIWEFTGFGALQALLRPVAAWAHQQAPLRGLLSLIAEDIAKTPIEGYLPRLEWLYMAYGRVSIVSAALIATLAAGRGVLPRSTQRLLLGGGAAVWPVLLSGSVLGFAIAIRPIGVFGGVLASGLLIHRLKGRSAGLLFVYWVMAGLVAYEAWPRLWETPLASFWDSLFLLTDFNLHEVLYRGVVYPSTGLPWHYLPTLLALQLTEAVVPLALLGLFAIIRSAGRGAGQRGLLIAAGLWFLVPVAMTRLPGTGLYNGFRLLLFVLPPLFIGFGFGLQWLFRAIRAPVAQWVLWGLILAFGVGGIARLHPYEYAYFNSYAGGLRGTQADFDQEYWCTSYREAMGYVNAVAAPGAIVFSGRSLFAAVPFARPDLVLTNQAADYPQASLLLYCARFREDQVWVRGHPVLEVGRAGTAFAQVYRLEGGTAEAP